MATEKRLIDANALRQEVESKIYWGQSNNVSALEAIDDAPTVDAVEVVHGEWIDGRPYVNSRWKVCSVCHCTGPDPQGGFEYCPNCGAKMDGGKPNEV